MNIYGETEMSNSRFLGNFWEIGFLGKAEHGPETKKPRKILGFSLASPRGVEPLFPP